MDGGVIMYFYEIIKILFASGVLGALLLSFIGFNDS
jgi:hypothetical protein